ncbi:hypothetical protein MOQ72_25110 [Saccharopolyspora sp. K220]|uniref:hypothetical protein n=1 Tax=Saccharopolyspora soli TaxID=2926618 RepID=UPI001F593FBE|nr:hypothetical protein [Saccharopolyspora soli]MCI2420732.1 hypothetical protein [Saccharopolyspora soli]
MHERLRDVRHADGLANQIRHFQYREGVVPEWCRFAHIRCGASDSLVRSWCRQLFQATEVEDCSAPGEPRPGLPVGMRECADCFVAVKFPGLTDRTPVDGMIPARIDTPREMASAMQVLQQDLVDEASRIPAGDVDPARLGRLAADTERFASALRRFGWLATRG